jgi:integrase/recombinase XerD
MRVHSTAVRPLTADERRRLLHVPPSVRSPWPLRDATILALLLETGLRASELCAITHDALSDRNGERLMIDIRGTKGIWRRVLLSPETTVLVRNYLDQEQSGPAAHEQALFLGDQAPLAVQGVSAIVQAAGKRTSIAEPLTVHRLRQTALSDVWNARREAREAREDS